MLATDWLIIFSIYIEIFQCFSFSAGSLLWEPADEIWLNFAFQIFSLTPTYIPESSSRVAKFKCPRVLGDQNISEDNQKLGPVCPPDYQIFWGKELNQTFSSQQIFQVIFLFTNKTAV